MSSPLRTVDALVIGAGVAGIAVAAKLRANGVNDLVIVDQQPEFGGTWYANTYPGVACDIPSQVYSYAFSPARSWSRVFAPGAEIQRYLLDVVERHRLRACAMLGTRVDDARWDDDAGRWTVRTSGDTYAARFLLVGTGLLEAPRIPQIPGLADFPGQIFHTARWPDDAEIDGRHVAVIGTGASSIQIVPEVQRRAARLTLFQRTPAWVFPKPDIEHSHAFLALYERSPAVRRAFRAAQWTGIELFMASLYSQRASSAMGRVGRWNIERAIADPELRRALTPDYIPGCKRELLSNHYYPALAAPNAEVIPAAVTAARDATLIAADGSERQVDTVIFATGFQAAEPPIYRAIHARDGRTVAARWDGRPEAYLGTAIAGCPNMFVFSGPNGSTASVFVGLESTAVYAAAAIATARDRGVRTLEVRPELAREWKRQANEHLAGNVHSTGGCTSYYVDRDNNNQTLFPASMRGMKRALSTFNLDDYLTTGFGSEGTVQTTAQASGSTLGTDVAPAPTWTDAPVSAASPEARA